MEQTQTTQRKRRKKTNWIPLIFLLIVMLLVGFVTAGLTLNFELEKQKEQMVSIVTQQRSIVESMQKLTTYLTSTQSDIAGTKQSIETLRKGLEYTQSQVTIIKNTPPPQPQVIYVPQYQQQQWQGYYTNNHPLYPTSPTYGYNTKSGEVTGGYWDTLPLTIYNGIVINFTARNPNEPLRVAIKNSSNQVVQDFGMLTTSSVQSVPLSPGQYYITIANTNTLAIGTRGYTLTYQVY